MYHSTVVGLLGFMLIASVLTEQWQAAIPIAIAFTLFTNTVSAIGKSNDTPQEAYAALERAGTTAILESLTGIGLTGMAAAAADDEEIELLSYHGLDARTCIRLEVA